MGFWLDEVVPWGRSYDVLSSTDPPFQKACNTKIGRIEALAWNVSLATKPNADGCKIPGSGDSGANCPIDGGGDY